MKFRQLYLIPLLSVLLTACGADEQSPNPIDRDTSSVDFRSSADSAVFADSSIESGEKVILFLGNSLSAGLGVDSDESFPSLIQERIDSLGWNFKVVNAGVSGETTSGGLSRIDWALRQPIDVLVLELGGNDGLRGIPVEVTKQNLEEIITRTQATYPNAEIVLAGMQMPPNLGAEYTSQFRDVFYDLAEENDIHLIPFLLEGVGGVESMMQDDRIHPNAAGHQRAAANVWEVLEPVLADMRETEV